MTCYESTNGGQHSTQSVAKITATRHCSITAYIRSNGESNFDYIICSELNPSTYPTIYSNSTVFVHTRGNPQSSNSLSNYSTATFNDMKAGDYFYIVYRKDSSSNSGDDKGWFMLNCQGYPERLKIGKNFAVDSKGNLVCQNSSITGHINATSGRIGNLKISSEGITTDYFELNSQSFYISKGKLNLNNRVLLYTDASKDYLTTTGDKDFIIKNSAGAGLEFSSQVLNETTNLVIKLHNFQIPTPSHYTTNEQYGYSPSTQWTLVTDHYEYALTFDWNVTLNGSAASLASSKDLALKIYIMIRKEDGSNVSSWLETINYTFTVPAGNSSGTGVVFYRHSRTNNSYSHSENSWPTSILGAKCTLDDTSYGDFWSDSDHQYTEIPISQKTSTNKILYSLGSLYPKVTEEYNLGTSGLAWNCITAKSSAITNSDSRLKHDVEELNSKYDVFFDNLRSVSYILNKADSGRKHLGFIAQEVEQALNLSKISLDEFGGICIGQDEDKTYGLRYEEFISLNTSQIQKLKTRVKTLEEEVQELKEEIHNLKENS